MTEPTCEYRLGDLPEHLRSRIAINPATGCWEWQGHLNVGGYGQVWHQRRHWPVHILVWTLLAEPVPEGLELDHVYAAGCRSKHCCWPAHLEPVTHEENMRRWTETVTHCVNGHELTPENTILNRGWRDCRKCVRIRARARSAKRTPEFYRERYARRKQQRLEKQ